MSTPHRDGSLWVYVPDSPADEPWLNPGVVQGPPGQQGPPGDEGPEGPPGTARILHLISAPTTVQSTALLPVNGWSWPVEAGRSYHVRGMANISPSGAGLCRFGLGGSAQVSLVQMLIQFHGTTQTAFSEWNNTYQQTGWNAVGGCRFTGGGGRLSCSLDGWMVVSVAGTAAMYANTDVNAPVFNLNGGSVLEVISTTAARQFQTFGEVASAADPEWH